MFGDTKQFWFAFISHWQMGVCAFFLDKQMDSGLHTMFCIILLF